jgi:REP element-mobilizing transposase RayT
MARVARVVAPGLPHHVTQRCNRRQQVFFTDEDFAEYQHLMASSCEGCGTQVWADCLMLNHVHLIMVPGEEDGLRCAVAEAHRRYTRMINFRQGWRGHLWQERFHSVVMDEQYGDFSQQSYQLACPSARLPCCAKGNIAGLCAPLRASVADENPAQSGNCVSSIRLSAGSGPLRRAQPTAGGALQVC